MLAIHFERNWDADTHFYPLLIIVGCFSVVPEADLKNLPDDQKNYARPATHLTSKKSHDETYNTTVFLSTWLSHSYVRVSHWLPRIYNLYI